MGHQELYLVLLVITAAAAQTYKVCVSSSSPSSVCEGLDKDGSQASCESVDSRIDCALKLARGEADFGYFSGDEVLLLAQQQPNDNRLIATVRAVDNYGPYALESVAVVPNTHTGGLEGLRGGYYCHLGLDQPNLPWSPRVLKTLEQSAAQTDRCSDGTDIAGKTAEELEVEALSKFFTAGCRPGSWSANASVDASLKSKFPNLCSLCGDNTCDGYTIPSLHKEDQDQDEPDRHVEALECLRTNSKGTAPAVSYVAWEDVRWFFARLHPQDAASYSLLCPDGTLQSLTPGALAGTVAPCSFVKQPWGAIIANTDKSAAIQISMRMWWTSGANPNDDTWQSALFSAIIEDDDERLVYEYTPFSIPNYISSFYDISNIDSTSSCVPARRWCTLNDAEQTKCTWSRAAANILGLQPSISCELGGDVVSCLKDIRDGKADFISAPSNYGYLARQEYKLSPVKLVQNQRDAASRIVAFVKESAAQGQITSFENLRDGRACFPEYGGLGYVAFVRAAQELGVISESECDYGKAVGEFFSGACAPGAADLADAQNLCSLCKPALNDGSNSICSNDWTNMYFGNNGSLACLADPSSDVAFVDVQNIATDLGTLDGSMFRALCRNNTLALSNGVLVDDNCALAYVVDAEVVTRRNDPLYNALNALFDTLDSNFGYNADSGKQLINLELFSSFDGTKDLLFKDSTIGLTEPLSESFHEPAKNYIELFRHLQACTSWWGAGPPAPGFAARNIH